jgi:hypothetical protein
MSCTTQRARDSIENIKIVSLRNLRKKQKRIRVKRYQKLLWLSYKYDGGDDAKV